MDRIIGNATPTPYPIDQEFSPTSKNAQSGKAVAEAIAEIQISGGSVQSDWDEENSTSMAYIKNKPTNISQFVDDTSRGGHFINFAYEADHAGADGDGNIIHETYATKEELYSAGGTGGNGKFVVLVHTNSEGEIENASATFDEIMDAYNFGKCVELNIINENSPDITSSHMVAITQECLYFTVLTDIDWIYVASCNSDNDWSFQTYLHEKSQNKVTSITDANSKNRTLYPSVNAVVDYVETAIIEALDESITLCDSYLSWEVGV